MIIYKDPVSGTHPREGPWIRYLSKRRALDQVLIQEKGPGSGNYPREGPCIRYLSKRRALDQVLIQEKGPGSGTHPREGPGSGTYPREGPCTVPVKEKYPEKKCFIRIPGRNPGSANSYFIVIMNRLFMFSLDQSVMRKRIWRYQSILRSVRKQQVIHIKVTVSPNTGLNFRHKQLNQYRPWIYMFVFESYKGIKKMLNTFL